MELIVLGGSAAAPNPNGASAGYLVRSGEAAILIDCGSGVVSKLRAQCDPRALSGVIISHLHSDHILDLVALRYCLQYVPPGPGAPLPLYLPPRGIDFLNHLGAVFAVGNEDAGDFWTAVFSPMEYGAEAEEGRPLTIGPLSIRLMPMVHYIPAWAMRITERTTGRVLTFSADTGPTAPLAAFAAASDLLLCEATILEQTGDDPALWGHLTGGEAGSIAAKARARRLVLTHLWQELGFDNYLAAARHEFDGPIDLAYSGSRFSV
jgi:ribonuclease BN (tRNA processing enzyme)